MISLHVDLKYDANELIHETETDSQTQRTDYGHQGGERAGRIGSLGLADED